MQPRTQPLTQAIREACRNTAVICQALQGNDYCRAMGLPYEKNEARCIWLTASSMCREDMKNNPRSNIIDDR